jgi:membrane-bound serine protease (ClpP class)
VRRRTALFLLFFVVASALGATFASAQSSKETGPVVDVVEAFGVLDAQLAGHVVDRIHEANEDKSTLIVIELDSAGALESDVQKMIDAVNASRVPVAVWVGPRRATARGAAAMLVVAAHISGIGPSATLGPLSPTDLRTDPSSAGGRAETEKDLDKADRLASARYRAIPHDCPARVGRRACITHSPEVILRETLGANASVKAHVVDVVVPSVAELLRFADFRNVVTAAGPVTLRVKTDEVAIRLFKPGPIRAMLHTFATSPALVYICLLGAAMLVAFEFFQPGFGIAGFSGAFLLAGGVFGLTVLPVGILGLVLFTLGAALLTVDVALNELGLASIAGTALLVIGSLRMFPAPAGALGLPGWLAILGAIASLIFFVPVMTLVRRSRRDPETQRAARALVGMPGQVRSMLNPEGFVWVADALWRARSEDGTRLRVGEDVVVTGADGVLLHVKRG